jgi:lysozyme
MQDPLSSLPLARGIDVSKSQGTVSWPAVRGAGYVFTYVKATDGQDYVDPFFAQNWTGAASAGLLRGAYHFFRAEDSPQAQAEFFWKTVGENGDLPLVVDVEENMGEPGPALLSNLTQLLEQLQQLSGRRPMIYTDPGFWNGLSANNSASNFGDFPLWVADYPPAGVFTPTVPIGWASWDFWQYYGPLSTATDYVQVPGVSCPVDLDVFNGSAASLLQWAQKGS